jgi:hypothetical protein
MGKTSNVLCILFDGCNDFEVLATSAIAKKILGIFGFLVQNFGCLCCNLFVRCFI